MEGYKVFNPDWTCKDFKFEVGRIYEENVKPVCCEKGFHFCRELKDCFKYYKFDARNKVAKVIALGEIDHKSVSGKYCTNKIKIVEEIGWDEVLRVVNIGKANIGLCNTGSANTGSHNTGDENTGNWNTGYSNSGNWNSGEYNIGNRNTGHNNNGNHNCGNYNIGDRNSGDYNIGNYNSGDYNNGNFNIGDWNKANFSNGCFNTADTKIFLFNKLSNWSYNDWINSEARRLLEGMPDDAENRRLWWGRISETCKEIIKGIPNFDAKIFEEITGIKI